MSFLSNRINVFCNRFIRARMKRMWADMDGRPLSILSNNCLGGLVCHDLGLRFDTPTVNLCMPLPSFVLMMEHVDEALVAYVKEISDNSRPYPVGALQLATGNIELHFMHYQDFSSAVKTWRRRSARVDKGRLVIVAAENVRCDDSILSRFHSLPFRKILLTAEKRTVDLLGEEAFLISGLTPQHLAFTDFCGLFGKRFYHQFDWVDWLHKSFDHSNDHVA